VNDNWNKLTSTKAIAKNFTAPLLFIVALCSVYDIVKSKAGKYKGGHQQKQKRFKNLNY